MGAVYPGRLQRRRDVGTPRTRSREHLGGHPPRSSAPARPENQQLSGGPGQLQGRRSRRHAGIAVHCAQGSAFCADAKGVKYGQASAAPNRGLPTCCPTSLAGTRGSRRCSGTATSPRNSAPAPDLSRGGYPVTNAAGNLVDLNGNQINGAFLDLHPASPGSAALTPPSRWPTCPTCWSPASRWLNGLLSDIHGNEDIPRLSALQGPPASARSAAAAPATSPRRSTTTQAFGAFFQRLAAEGIAPQTPLFLLSSDEGDRQAGANVGRAIQPTPATCDGASVPCTYPAGSFGELAGNITGLLATEKNDTTPFTLESDTAPEFYVDRQDRPRPTPPGAQARAGRRRPDRGQPVHRHHPEHHQLPGRPHRRGHPAHSQRGPGPHADVLDVRRQARLLPVHRLGHVGRCSPAPCVTPRTPGFAWDHGDYAAEIDTNYLGIAGPGVRNLGPGRLHGQRGPQFNQPGQRPDHRPGQRHPKGTLVDETDIRADPCST